MTKCNVYEIDQTKGYEYNDREEEEEEEEEEDDDDD